MVITETTLEILDDKLFQNGGFDPNTYFPSFLKMATANFLSKTPEQWINWMSMYNQGTYNSQWMLLDTKQAQSAVGESDLLPGTFFVMEQIPGSTISMDMTDTFNQESYWASYNVPYYQEHYESAGYSNIFALTHADDYSYDQNPRAVQFAQMEGDVNNVDDLKYVIRFNSMVQSGQRGEIGDTIAARFDLMDEMDVRYLFGETDAKVTNIAMAQAGAFSAIAGPTTIEGLEAFKIPDHIYATLRGVPQTYNFEWENFMFKF